MFCQCQHTIAGASRREQMAHSVTNSTNAGVPPPRADDWTQATELVLDELKRWQQKNIGQKRPSSGLKQVATRMQTNFFLFWRCSECRKRLLLRNGFDFARYQLVSKGFVVLTIRIGERLSLAAVACSWLLELMNGFPSDESPFWASIIQRWRFWPLLWGFFVFAFLWLTTCSGSCVPPVSRFHSSKVLFEIFPSTRS
jgi:hypothetical protein